MKQIFRLDWLIERNKAVEKCAFGNLWPSGMLSRASFRESKTSFKC
jgi:hypothetical protein